MPTCKLCSATFPNVVVIDGKQRFLQHRRRCLTCSPFVEGSRSTSQRGDKICAICGRQYFYDRKNRGGHTLTQCNSCNCNSKRGGKKEKAVEYLGGGCKICGYNKCIQALSFHHIDGKDFTISRNYGCSWETLKKELDKCVLLCQNCHQEVHYSITLLP